MSGRSDLARRLAALSELARGLEPTQTMAIPVAWVLELIEAIGPYGGALEPDDPTAEELARHFRRRPSTVRNWCAQGRFPGAYKRGHTWHVPPAGVAAFQEVARGSGRGSRAGRIGDWRDVRRRTTAAG